MLLFRSEEHLDGWLEPRRLSRGAVLTVEQVWGLADAWYRDKLEPDWHRKSPQEAEAIFESLGLTGEFWRLEA